MTEKGIAATKTKASRLETLRKKQDQLKAQIAALEAKDKSVQRKEDTRLKIVIGAALMADSTLHPETAAFIADVLNRAITAERDKALLRKHGWLTTPKIKELPTAK